MSREDLIGGVVDPKAIEHTRLSTAELERRVDEFVNEQCPLGKLDLEQGGCTCINECALGHYPPPE